MAFPDQEWKVSPAEKVLYLNPAEFRPFIKPEVRQLSAADSHDLTVMHQGCSLAEQQAGEVNIDHPAIFGAYAGNRLAAAASLIDQGQGIADVGVLVHRDFRGQGYGRAVVSALSQWGLDNERIVQYWRLCATRRFRPHRGFAGVHGNTAAIKRCTWASPRLRNAKELRTKTRHGGQAGPGVIILRIVRGTVLRK